METMTDHPDIRKKNKKKNHSKGTKCISGINDSLISTENTINCEGGETHDTQTIADTSNVKEEEASCHDFKDKKKKRKRKDKSSHDVNLDTSKDVNVNNESKYKHAKNDNDSSYVKRRKKDENVIENSCNDSVVADNVEEEDPVKVAIREKKREKRKQKKLEKLKIKQEREARAGTAKASAIAYLNQWDTNRDEWKFMKVRQVWCLQNMYDSQQVDDNTFDILLRYLKPLTGRSKETTVSSAEAIIKETEGDTNADDELAVKADRARHIIQLLSD